MTMAATIIDDGAREDAPPPSAPRASAVHHQDIVLELVISDEKIELFPDTYLIQQSPLQLLHRMLPHADRDVLLQQFIEACANKYILAAPSPIECSLCIVSTIPFTDDIGQETLHSRLSRLREAFETFRERAIAEIEESARRETSERLRDVQAQQLQRLEEIRSRYESPKQREIASVNSARDREKETRYQEYLQACTEIDRKADERIAVIEQSAEVFQSLELERVIPQQQLELETFRRAAKSHERNQIATVSNPLVTMWHGIIRAQKASKRG